MTQPPERSQRIDAHHHIWTLSERAYDWLEGDDLDAIRVDRTVAQHDRAVAGLDVVGSVIVEAQGSLDEACSLLRAAAARDTACRVVTGFDPCAERLDADLDALGAMAGSEALAGVRHQMQSEDLEWFERRDVRVGLERVAERGLVIDLVITADQLAACTDLVADVPTATFVLDHLAKPPLARGDLVAWRRDLAVLADQRHVVAKVSGLLTETRRTGQPTRDDEDDIVRAIAHAIDVFGPSRLLWGTDWPVCELASDPVTWARLTDRAFRDLTDTQRQLIHLGNAARVYGFDDAVHDDRSRL